MVRVTIAPSNKVPSQHAHFLHTTELQIVQRCESCYRNDRENFNAYFGNFPTRRVIWIVFLT